MAWGRWLSTAGNALQPHPYEGRLDIPGDDEEILRLMGTVPGIE